MSNSTNIYTGLIKEAMKENNRVTKETVIAVKNLYKEVAEELIKKAETAKGGFTKTWLKDYEKYIKIKISELDYKLYILSEEAIKTSAQLAAGVQGDFVSYINDKYNLNIDKELVDFAYSTNGDVIGQILQGGFYKDNRSLSDRLWNYSNNYKKNVNYIMAKGLAEQKSYQEIIKDLEKYVNPNAKKDWNFKKVYPSCSRNVDYNAQRLLRTSMTHMFRLQSDKKALNNPFVTNGKWNLSSEHQARQVKHFGPDECDDRAGKLFDKDNIPIQHPQCLCYITYEIPKSLDSIGEELEHWIRGGNNPNLEKWFEGLSNFDDKIVISKDDNNDIISNKKWLNAGFSSKKKFDKHINKHLLEYGDITEDEYLKKARELLAEEVSDDVEGFISEANFIYKYKHSTNDLAIGRDDKDTISTLYKPIKGYEEFINEKKMFEKKG